MSSLAELYLQTGRHREAADLARQVWEIRARVLGEGNVLTADSLVLRARAAVGLNDDESARKWGDQALVIRKRAYGEENAETLEVVELLALNSLHAGRATEAAESFARCLTARQRSAGEAAPATLQTMLYLASSLDQLGNKDRADMLRQRVASLKPQR
jgi:hypothetical protein